MRMLDLVRRTAALALAWLIVSEGRMDYWYYGVITVAAAVVVSVLVSPLRAVSLPAPRQLLAGARLAGWMLWKSVLGAFDVARRALGPARLVAPVEQVEPLRLPLGDGGLLASALANLLPGALIHRIEKEEVHIHALAPDIDARDSWKRLQDLLAQALRR